MNLKYNLLFDITDSCSGNDPKPCTLTSVLSYTGRKTSAGIRINNYLLICEDMKLHISVIYYYNI